MKIEKGKLYYNGVYRKIMKAEDDINNDVFSNKIAVHCPTKEDWDYVVSKGYSLFSLVNGVKYDVFYSLIENGWCDKECFDENGFKTISIEEFKEFYPEIESGKKETSNKLNYELDFDFITQMAERMQTNKGKYEPYNWKKPIDTNELAQAILRHTLEVLKGNYKDDGRELGHLEAIACNAMMFNYQVKNNK